MFLTIAFILFAIGSILFIAVDSYLMGS